MSIPHTPDGETRSILQLSKPYLSAAEIKYCHSIQGVTASAANQVQYSNSKLEMWMFLRKLIKLLKFPTNVLQLTMTYYQRFYMFNEYEVYKNSKYDIAVTALYISSKLLDYIKKLRDIVKTVNELAVPGLVISESKILVVEKKLLQTIDFDFRFQSAEDFIMRIGNHLKLDENIKYTSWLINNDAYLTELNVRFPCNVVALACVKLALGIHEREMQLNNREFRIFKDVFVIESVEEILQSYMDNYNNSWLSQEFENKQEMMDRLITLKIGINEQLQEFKPSRKKPLYKMETDEFFKIDRNFGKNDNVRFVYQKANYIDEL